MPDKRFPIVIARGQFLICMSMQYAMENGCTAVFHRGQFVEYAIFHLHLGTVKMEDTACGKALGFVNPMRLKLAGRTCVSICLFSVNDVPWFDGWNAWIALQEISRMASKCLNQMCIAMYGSVQETEFLKRNWRGHLVEDVLEDDNWEDRFRLGEPIQKRVFALARGYRVSKSFLAEVIFLNTYDYNRCLKRFKYVTVDNARLSMNERELIQRMVTLNVQDTSLTSRFIGDMYDQFQQFHRDEDPFRFLTQEVAAEIRQQLASLAGHVIAFFIHANWLPGSARARMSLVELADMAINSRDNRNFPAAFHEEWSQRYTHQPSLNHWEACPDRQLVGPSFQTPCGNVIDEIERGIDFWIDDFKYQDHRGAGPADYTSVVSSLSLLDPIFEGEGNTHILCHEWWRRPLVSELQWTNMNSAFLQEMHTVKPPRAVIEAPPAKAARTDTAAASSASALSPPRSAPPSNKIPPPVPAPMISSPSPSVTGEVHDAKSVVSDTQLTEAVRGEPGTGEPIDSQSDAKIASQTTSSGTVLPAMAPTPMSSEQQPDDQPEAMQSTDVAMAMTDTTVHPPIASAIASTFDSTSAVSTAGQPSVVPAPSGMLASTGLLPSREASIETKPSGPPLPTGAGGSESTPSGTPLPTGASGVESIPSEGPLQDLLEVFQLRIEDIPLDLLMDCLSSLETRIAELTTLRKAVVAQKAWSQLKKLQSRIAMFNDHMDRIGQELGERS